EPDEAEYEDLVEGTVDDVKEAVREGEFDPATVLAVEQENKDRSTLVSWLEGRTDEDTGEADVDYDGLVQETIADIKDRVWSADVDAEKVLEAERAGKERTTLIDWLESRTE
ncbi:MAG: hypothetical protein ABEK12_02445, partial [Candidatus Nanohaloarchaea archaeon]